MSNNEASIQKELANSNQNNIFNLNQIFSKRFIVFGKNGICYTFEELEKEILRETPSNINIKDLSGNDKMEFQSLFD